MNVIYNFSIDNVLSVYGFIENELILSVQNYISIINNTRKTVEKLFLNHEGIYTYGGKCWCIKDGMLEMYLFESSSFKDIWKGKKYDDFYPLLSHSDIIIEEKYLRKNKELSICLFNKMSQELLWERTCDNMRFVLNDKNFIALRDIRKTHYLFINPNTGDILWELKLPEGQKVDKISSTQREIILSIQKGDTPREEYSLVALDLKTGEKIWNRENEQWNYSLHEESETLVLVNSEYYRVISLETGELIVDTSFEEIVSDKYQISNARQHIQESGLFFSGEVTGSVAKQVFGKIDVLTHQLVYIEEIKVGDHVQIDTPSF